MQKLQIFKIQYYEAYKNKFNTDYFKMLVDIKQKDFTAENFKFYNSLSSIYSSKIEGEPMEVDSYVKHKMLNVQYLKNITNKIDDLFTAYEFAQNNKLTYKNFLHAHAILTRHFLPAQDRGKIRSHSMYVMDQNDRVVYIAANPEIVDAETKKLFHDIVLLLKVKMKVQQLFYTAAMIHLQFVAIHPLMDGNGRTARLLEKWFLSEKLNEIAWFIQTEKFYFKNIESYYKNLNDIGNNYNTIDYSKSIPFLLMLPESLTISI